MIWIISLFYLLGTVLSLFVYFGGVPLPFSDQIHLQSPAVDLALELLLGTANLGGALALFLLRRQALYLFVGAFFLRSLLLIWHPPGFSYFDPMGARVLAGSLALPITVSAYTWRQVKTGLLS